MSEPVLKIEARGEIAVLTMNRPDKRNAMCDALLQAIDAFFLNPPAEIKAVDRKSTRLNSSPITSS